MRHSGFRLYKLARQGVRATGTITDLQPRNHQLITASYTIRGRDFSATGRTGFGNPEFSMLRKGNPVIVYYLPESPAICSVGIPAQILGDELWIVGLAIVVMSTLVIGSIAARRFGL